MLPWFNEHSWKSVQGGERGKKSPLTKLIPYFDRSAQMHTCSTTCPLWRALIHIEQLPASCRRSRPNLCHILLSVTRHERCMHDILERGYTPRGSDSPSLWLGLVRQACSEAPGSSLQGEPLSMRIESRSERRTVLKRGEFYQPSSDGFLRWREGYCVVSNYAE